MSKELIEKLREAAKQHPLDAPLELFNEAADALEAKGAPVGERLVVTVVEPDSRTTTEHAITERDVILLWNRIDTLERELAAHQRAQQPQSAEAVAWVEVKDRHEGPYDFHGMELMDSGKHYLYTTPQPSAGGMMPDALDLLAWLRGAINCNAENDTGRHGVWFSTKHPMIQRIDSMLARLNGKEVV